MNSNNNSNKQIKKDIGSFIKEKLDKIPLTREEIAREIGVSRPTLHKIESGKTNLELPQAKKLAEIFNISLDDLYNGRDSMDLNYNIINDEKLIVAEKFEERICIPVKNINKLKEVLIYILNKVGAKPNIGETVIYKLLYFIDFDFYEKYEEQLMGCTYIKNHHGPTPVEFKKVIDDMIKDKEIEKIKSEYFKYPQTKYLALRKADLSLLKANELTQIDEVLCRLSDKNASEISNYSHNDIPWITAGDGEAINYESVFYRTADYSVRSYKDSDSI